MIPNLEKKSFENILEILTHPPFLFGKEKNLEEKILQCEKYLNEILIYNEKINITARMSNQSLFKNHLLDSLLAWQFFKPFEKKKVADIGSGAGFPAIPLAIFLPEVSFSLIESKQKKVNFLLQMKEKLNLKNINILCQNVNEITQKFDAVTCRAFASLFKIRKLTTKMCHSKTKYLLYKGRKKIIEEEIKELKKINHHKIYPLLYEESKEESRAESAESSRQKRDKILKENSQERHLVFIHFKN